MADAPVAARPVRLQAEAGEYFDKELPESVRKGQRITTMTSGQARFPVAPSMFKFAQHGKSRSLAQRIVAEPGHVVDDICIVKIDAHRGDQSRPGHHLHPDRQRDPRPAEHGCLAVYGIGSPNQNLPAFVVLHSRMPSGGTGQALCSRAVGIGFPADASTRVCAALRRRPGAVSVESAGRRCGSRAPACSMAWPN